MRENTPAVFKQAVKVVVGLGRNDDSRENSAEAPYPVGNVNTVEVRNRGRRRDENHGVAELDLAFGGGDNEFIRLRPFRYSRM